MTTIAGPIIFGLNALAIIALGPIKFWTGKSYQPDFNTSHKWLTRIFYLLALLTIIFTIIFFATNEITLAGIGMVLFIVSVGLILTWPELREYTLYTEETRFKRRMKTIRTSFPQAKIVQMKQPTRL